MIRILVVDPQEQTGFSVAKALEGQKMQPTVVCDRDEALRQLSSNPPDAVILAAVPWADWSEELCRALCQRTLVPLLVVGDQENDLLVERVLAAGADAHVLEPFHEEVLVAQLWALLRRVGLVATACPA
jgi:two-component system response regulator MprA